jgi:hypothetical protein
MRYVAPISVARCCSNVSVGFVNVLVSITIRGAGRIWLATERQASSLSPSSRRDHFWRLISKRAMELSTLRWCSSASIGSATRPKRCRE